MNERKPDQLVDEGPITVAVVEPSELLRAGIERVLAESGYQLVLAVASGGELLTALRNGLRVRLVLLELVLPVMDGITVLARLRERHAEVRAIAMAHEPSDELVVRAMRQDACTVLSTELGIEGLRKAMRDVLLTRHHLSELLRRQLVSVKEMRRNVLHGTPAPSGVPKVSPMEMAYWKLHCTMENPTIARVAARLGCKPSSARTLRRRLFRKLGVRGSQELLRAGLRYGIVDL